MTVHLGGMSPCCPPFDLSTCLSSLVLPCPSLSSHFFWQRFPLSISSSSSEMLFVVAFINQHSADAAAPFSPSFFLFHQRSRLSDSRLPSGSSSIAGLALRGGQDRRGRPRRGPRGRTLGSRPVLLFAGPEAARSPSFPPPPRWFLSLRILRGH